MKRSSLQHRVSKFTPKKFYEIEPRNSEIEITGYLSKIAPEAAADFVDIGAGLTIYTICYIPLAEKDKKSKAINAKLDRFVLTVISFLITKHNLFW
jgi:hypothetical protein